MIRSRALSFLTLAAVLATALQTTSHAQGPERRMYAGLAARLEKGLKRVDFKPRLSRGEASKRVTVLIEYEGLPATRAFAAAVREGRGTTAASGASREAVARNRSAQAGVRAALAGLGGRELYSTQRVLNATVAVIDAKQVPALRRLPGVKRVVPAPIHKLNNSTSVPFVGANRAWDSSGILGQLGLTGQGITAAVIDTGIDYVHTNFGGDANYAAQTDVTSTIDSPFPTAKVVAGFDFVGDNYDASSDDPAENTPVPDDDPTDCNGHGSHVAGSLAGFGVDGGATYSGGYDNLDATTLAGFDIGPGVAPNASLVALKVFGCDGSTAVTIQAIEFAVDPNGDGDVSDRVDVINMSLGSSWGNPHDPSSDAADNAVEAGVIVVASAGNASDNYYAVSSPSLGKRVLSVAASADPGVSTWAVVDGTGRVHTALPADFGAQITTPTPDPPAPIEQPSGPDTGCAAGDFTGFTAGNVALVDRGGCAFETKAANAQGAGASAVIIDNVTTCAAFNPGNDPDVPDTVTIPTVMVSCVAGAALKAALPTTGQIDPTRGFNLQDTVADFSSRGPGRPASQSWFKPEVTAPGVAITSTQTGYDGTLGTGVESLTISGTSMASPHVAGTMALLRQQRPTWPITHLKALVMNTALHNVFLFDTIGGVRGPVIGSGRIGAGRLDVPAALASSVVAYGVDDPDLVGIFVGRDVVGTQASTVTREIELVNHGTRAAGYRVMVRRLVDASGVNVTASPSTVTVPARGTARVRLTVTFNPRRMLHDLEPSVADIQSGDPRHWLTEESGFVLLRSTAGSRPDLRLPYDVQPRPASLLSGNADPARSVGGGGVLRLRGPAVGNFSSRTTPSGLPIDQVSVVSSHDLLWESGKADLGSDNAWDSGDIRYLGASTDVSQGGITSYAAFNMWKNWGSPSELEVYVCADLNQDGSGGAFGDGTDWCWISVTVDETDRHRTYLWDINNFLGGGAFAIFEWDFANVVPVFTAYTRLLHSDSMVIPFETGEDFWDGGFLTGSGDDGSEAFDFSVFTVHYDDPAAAMGFVTDGSPLFTYDPAAPAVDFLRSNGLPSAFGAQSPFDAVFDGSALFILGVNVPPGEAARALLIHHVNPVGSRAEVVEIATPVATSNVLVNGDFETDADANLRPDGWTGMNLRSTDRLDSTNPRNGTFAFAFRGRSTATRSLRQNINISGPSGDAFRLDGFVHTDEAQLPDSLSIELTIYYTDGTSESLGRGVQMDRPYHSPFSVPLVVTAAKPYNRVRLQISARLTRNSSAVYLDDFTVEKGEF